MIQRIGIGLCWQSSACVLVLIALVGCSESTPVARPTEITPPATAEQSNAAPAEIGATAAKPNGEVAATEKSDLANAEASRALREKPTETEQKPEATPRSTKTPKIALSVPDPPEYVFEPQVLMSQQDKDTCLVQTGEPFPDAQLSDLEGKKHSLKALFGEKLTVVVFWANANRLGREQFERLEAETVVPFENTGLRVVAINIGDPAEQIGDLLPADRELGFTILLDTDASLFSKVATQRHPRTYLLDAEGNILWFDIEYSRSAARELVNAIHVYLGDHKFGDS